MTARDLIEHTTDDECPCGPTSEPVKCDDGSVGWVIVHHALDDRGTDGTARNDEQKQKFKEQP